MQARYSILQVFLSAGEGFCTLSHAHGSASADLSSDLCVRIDRAAILGRGRAAVSAYLQKLGVYKATADVEAGSALYAEMTAVDAWWGGAVREAVMARRTPRKVFVQASTAVCVDEDERDGRRTTTVRLKEYEPSVEGMVRSYAERTYI